MSSTSLPTILLISGAFTTVHCDVALAPLVQQAGLPTEVAALRSCDRRQPEEHTAASDGKHLLEQHLLPLIEAGKDVVVFAHSFGATASSGAGSHLSKTERAAQGLSGGVMGLVYMSFALAPDDTSQLEYLGRAWPPFYRLNHVSSSLKQYFASKPC